MNRTPILVNPLDFPEPFQEMVARHPVFDSSCSDAAQVYFIDCDGGLFLKCADRGALRQEAAMTRYFHSKGLGALVLEELHLEKDWLLTARVPGEDCLNPTYLDAPERLCDTLAGILRKLHNLDAADCPIRHAVPEDVTPVLTHGDFCLPNVMLEHWRFSGLIDLGDAGLGDRHIDLFWAMWSLGHNLGTNRYSARLLDAYGREDFDPARLHAVAADIHF